jgi:hypothetical protein
MLSLRTTHQEKTPEPLSPANVDRIRATVTGSIAPRSNPTATVNLIKAVRDNGVHAIRELTDEIAELDVRRTRLVAEKETIQKMLTIAEEHADHVQR